MDIIHGNPLQDIETIANDDYVMQNGRLFTEQQLIGPYANVSLEHPARLRYDRCRWHWPRQRHCHVGSTSGQRLARLRRCSA